MRNADMPAMPTPCFDSLSQRDDGRDESGRYIISNGLTKREQFSAMAMQGILSNSGGVIQSNSMSGTGFCNSNPELLAKWSIECADALLAELERTK